MPNALSLFKANSTLTDGTHLFFYVFHVLMVMVTTGWLQAFDARSVAVQDNLVITTPNMHFVPEFHHFEEEDLQARADGRFGVVDCFQWPQAYDEVFPHAACIPRKESCPFPHPLHWAWFTPNKDDFIPVP